MFRKAAEQNEAKAQFLLGLAYEHGEGVEQDKFRAIQWYQKAAAQGNSNAQEALRRLQ
nr:SEL1-like repeat protein [Thiorhodovibrio winogradskyi]